MTDFQSFLAMFVSSDGKPDDLDKYTTHDIWKLADMLGNELIERGVLKRAGPQEAAVDHE